MNVIVTYLALVCLTALAIGIRLLWPRLGMRPRRQIFLVLALLLLPALLSTVSRWDTTSTHLNASLLWIRIFAYELCIVFFTLIQPRLLTTIIAIVLLLPVFSSSIVRSSYRRQLLSGARPMVKRPQRKHRCGLHPLLPAGRLFVSAPSFHGLSLIRHAMLDVEHHRHPRSCDGTHRRALPSPHF